MLEQDEAEDGEEEESSIGSCLVQDEAHDYSEIKSKNSRGHIEMYMSALQQYGREVLKQAALEIDHSNRRPNRRGSIYQTLHRSKRVTIEVFDDTHSMKELVYSIAVDR